MWLRSATSGIISPAFLAAVGIDPAANLDAVDDEINHRLHAHRLDHVEQDLERHPARLQSRRARLDDVLGAQPEDQLAADIRAIARLAVLRHRESQLVRQRERVSPLPFCTSWQGRKFIAGEPMKPATKRVSGVWYTS